MARLARGLLMLAIVAGAFVASAKGKQGGSKLAGFYGICYSAGRAHAPHGFQAQAVL
jgi:hypothetical protein